MLCLGMHSNVMHRFMVQAFQDPPLCSSTINQLPFSILEFMCMPKNKIKEQICLQNIYKFSIWERWEEREGFNEYYKRKTQRDVFLKRDQNLHPY